jgi:septum formation topological specificity factor MinE
MFARVADLLVIKEMTDKQATGLYPRKLRREIMSVVPRFLRVSSWPCPLAAAT